MHARALSSFMFRNRSAKMNEVETEMWTLAPEEEIGKEIFNREPSRYPPVIPWLKKIENVTVTEI
jgi:hypothetical protein